MRSHSLVCCLLAVASSLISEAAAGRAALLATGAEHNCAITPQGGVKCWGYNNYYQLGIPIFDYYPTPVAVPGLTSGVVSVATGEYFSCALTAAGGVKCWGDDQYAQLGDGEKGGYRDTPGDVVGLTSGVVAIAAGGYHACALTQAGGVKCWGDNYFFNLGYAASNAPQATPVDVIGLGAGVASITAGVWHTCAITTSGVAKCWGRDAYGELGDGAGGDPRATPADVMGLGADVVAIDGGWYHTCAVVADGRMYCWGFGLGGRLGDGDTTSHYRYSAQLVSGDTRFSAQVAATDSHTCALSRSTGAVCWGGDDAGQLGDGSSGNPSPVPSSVPTVAKDVLLLATADGHSCALLTTGKIKCWGVNTSYQVGDGSQDPVVATPAQLSGDWFVYDEVFAAGFE